MTAESDFDVISLDIAGDQARAFEMSARRGIDSTWFVRGFMHSEVARHLDLPWDPIQAFGFSYILGSAIDEIETHEPQPEHARTLSPDCMHWIGYVYRLWQRSHGLTSPHVYELADIDTMTRAYPAYHTLSCAQAIDRLMESRGIG